MPAPMIFTLEELGNMRRTIVERIRHDCELGCWQSAKTGMELYEHFLRSSEANDELLRYLDG